MTNRFFTKISQIIHNNPIKVIIAVVLLTIGLAFGLPNIQMNMGNEVFVDTNSQVYKDTKTYQENFGGGSAYVLISGDQDQIVTHTTMKKVAALENKINKVDHIRSSTSVVSLLNQELESNAASTMGGNAKGSDKLQKDLMANLTTSQKTALQTKLQASLTPEQQQQMGQYGLSLLTPQQKMAAAQAGNQSPATLMKQLDKTQQVKVQQYLFTILNQDQQQMLQKQMLADLPKVEHMSTALLRDLMLDSKGHVRSQLSALLPKNGQNLLIMANMAAKTDMTTNVQVVHDVRHDIKQAGFQSDLKVRLAGNPVIMGGIQPLVMKTMATMLVLAVIIMVVVLFVVFPVRRRLLSLCYVLLGLIWTFGIMGWLHIDLTLATMATLPIIIGLGIDFGVQFHNRYEEEFHKSASGEQATKRAIKTMGPAVGVALIVMVFSFLTMFLSKAPMMQQFGLTLAIGVAAAYVVEFLLMFSSFALLDRKSKTTAKPQSAPKTSGLAKALRKYAQFVIKHAKILTLVGIILAATGFSVEGRIPIETNLTKLIPQDMQALKDTKYLQKQVGSTTYMTYLVKADDVRDKAVLAKTTQFANRENHKYQDIVGVTTLDSTYRQMGGTPKQQTQTEINEGIKTIPGTIRGTMLSKNNHYTMVQFKVDRSLTTGQQRTLMHHINRDLKHHATTLDVHPAGDSVMMLVGVGNMVANHTLIILAGLAIIAIILIAVYRDLKMALLPILPIAIVLGLSPLTLHLLGESYNPLTIALSSLVLGVGTEFTILILERFKEEQQLGKSTEEAIIVAVTNVGQAITASGLTVIGGFAALIFTSFPVLSSFGLITVLDTLYSLIAALTILPAMIVISDKWFGGSKNKAK